MAATENLHTFFSENKKLVQDYLETRAEIYRLRFIKIFSQLAGHFIWLVISLVLLALLIIFLGLVTGFWLSEITGSYTKGFGLTVLIILALILLVAALRKILFVNPLIRFIIRKTSGTTGKENNDHQNIP